MKTWALRAATAFAFVLLVLLARKNWMYLQAGYHIRVGFEGGPYTAVDGVFPLWRKLSSIAVSIVLTAGVLLGMFARPSAVLVAGLGMAGTLMLGAYDVWWYGTIRSPTSVRNVVFAIALFAAAVSAKRAGVLQ
jgi:hypothetical protein